MSLFLVYTLAAAWLPRLALWGLLPPLLASSALLP